MLSRKLLLGGCWSAVYGFVFTRPVWAHGGDDGAAVYALGWREGLLLTAVFLVGYLYIWRVRQVWQRLGKGRGIPVWRPWFFLAALLTLTAALASPLEEWSGELFAAHMVQHLLLILVAAPLLVLGVSPAVIAWLAPAPWRRPFAYWLHRLSSVTESRFAWPLVVWLLYALALWLWHIPAWYEAALANELVHGLEHGAFLGTAVLFWWTLAYSASSRQTSLGLLFVFTTALHSGLLGVLLTFSRHVWYSSYATSPLAWGLTPLADQQLGGAIMWVIAGFIYVLAVVTLLHNWLRMAERREQWVT